MTKRNQIHPAQVHRGYIVKRNPMTGAWWAEQGGYLICSGDTPEAVKREIDTLIDG